MLQILGEKTEYTSYLQLCKISTVSVVLGYSKKKKKTTHPNEDIGNPVKMLGEPDWNSINFPKIL